MEPASSRQLLGAAHFKRSNPLSDRFGVLGFDHVEFWCGDASSAWRRFACGLGLALVGKSDQSTGNGSYASYVCSSGELTFVFTAPYAAGSKGAAEETPHPSYDQAAARDFQAAHGLAVRAVGLRVEDATAAYEVAVSHGGVGVLPPTRLRDGCSVVAELVLYGDVVLRLLSRPQSPAQPGDPFLPGYQCVAPAGDAPRCFGLARLDHLVGNVPHLGPAADYLQRLTGFHEFAEFVSADVGTVDSGLNSLVLASNDERVLLPLNEPTHGTRRRSQIQTFLEQHGGPGVQHMALTTHDIFYTLRCMRDAAGPDGAGGFDFMRSASDAYYDALPAKIGAHSLTPDQFHACRQLGILADRDDQGLLLQIFTKPVGDRPTLFLEIIQRVGCRLDQQPQQAPAPPDGKPYPQAAGCGGFGKGNFAELFRSIEQYEETLHI